MTTFQQIEIAQHKSALASLRQSLRTETVEEVAAATKLNNQMLSYL